MRLEECTVATFEPYLGDAFTLEPEALTLTLETATPGSAGAPGRAQFSLVFAGPSEPLLPQRIYRLEHAELGALEIFIVPIGRDGHNVRYEAVFS